MNIITFGGNRWSPVYIMTISQSNIVGVATGTANRAPNAKIWNGSAWVNLVFDTTGSASTNRGNSSTNIGPECAFAEAASAYYGRTVYIIKEATGSTSLDSISDWLPSNGATQGTKLASAITNIASALAALTSAGINYRVMGGVSMIGETEAGTASVAYRHGFNYCNAIKAIRDAAGVPYMRWVIGRPYDNGAAGVGSMATIRSREADVANWLDNITLLDTDSFARGAASVHFTEAGYNSLGTELFNAVNVSASSIGGFSLNQLPFIGPVYRTDVGASITKDGSNDISQWNDQTPANWHMGQSGSATLKPNYNSAGQGGIPSITFGGASLLSTGVTVGDTSAAGRTIQGADLKFSYIYVITPGSSANGLLLGKYGGSGSRASVCIMDGTKISPVAYFDSTGTNRRGRQYTQLTAGTRYSLILSYDGSVDSNDGADRFKVYVNGVEVSTAAFLNNGTLGDIQSTNYAPLALGAACSTGDSAVSNYYNGDIQFAALFGDICDASRATDIHNLLAEEFNI